MSATVQRRVEALEAVRNGGEFFTAIVIEIVSPGQAPATAWHIEFGGHAYRSAPGESQDDFTSRVTAIAIEMHGTRPGIPRVILRADDADI
jgi:hypothetical protein